MASVQYTFSQGLLASQFPPDAPLHAALTALLGDCGQHWFDLDAPDPGPQIVPLECCKVLLKQLTKMPALADKTLEEAAGETCYAGLLTASKAWQHQSAPYAN